MASHGLGQNVTLNRVQEHAKASVAVARSMSVESLDLYDIMIKEKKVKHLSQDSTAEYENICGKKVQ